MGFALLVCLGVLLPVGAGLFFHHYDQTRTRLAASQEAITRITAANVSAALVFRDAESAGEILSALRNEPLISSAIIRDSQARTFAVYSAASHDPTKPDSGHKITVDIAHSGETYGRLITNGNIAKELRLTATTWITVYALAVIASGFAAYFIARRFQLGVATPLVTLANTALRVMHERDYRTSRPVGGCSEVADLSKALNAMISEIGRRDARLAFQVEALNREIGERRTAEQTLRDNQHAMIRLSREAGMAEVAAGVLHNIGNALTSITVSSDLIDSLLANSRRRPVTSLRKLLDADSSHTGIVFSAHPDGPELRALLDNIAGTIQADIDETAELMAMMRTGIAHLKRIVSSQQSLARTTHVSELILLSDPLHEAIMLARTISPHAAPINECPTDPIQVYADRSMVVQILLNLLINAHEALVGQTSPPASIRVSIGAPDEDHVPVSVTDNGVGIAPEKLVSIFSYGYTTKPDGHGFGLHNAANAARLMGGSLAVESPGLGLGATFTLRLRLHRPETHLHSA